MQFFIWKPFYLAVFLGLLSACGDLPAGAPSSKQILKGSEAVDADFAVYPVTRDSLPKLKSWPRKPDTTSLSWLSRKSGPASQLIEPGDLVDLSIWDNGESSLLTQPGQKMVNLKEIRVSPNGDVFLPYIDQVNISRMTPTQARNTIQEKFSAIIPSAQVQISHMPGRQNSVDLISGVKNPGNVPLPDRDFSLLSLIAQGGGVSSAFKNPQVRLQRGNKLYGISAKRLLKEPRLDTTLRGGDKVYIEDDDRYFLSLGAARQEAQIPFPNDRINALDAVSLIGGLADTRANPKGVFVLRTYSPQYIGKGPTKPRAIFAIDLTSADGLFSAGEFQIEDRDVVLVTESSILGANTIISTLYQTLGIVTRANDIVEFR